MHVASSASLMHDGRVGVSVIVSGIVIVTVTLGIADRPRPRLRLRARAQMSLSFVVLLVRHLVVHSGLHCGDRDVFLFRVRQLLVTLSYVIAYPKYANIDFDQVISVCDDSVFDSPRFD